jgi:predicted RNase H-like HicB family nuclease
VTEANRYPAQVFWSDEDEGYIAIASDLPGCSAFGETQQKALEELQSAIPAWIEAQRAASNPIPAPSQPALENQHSGKVLVRMPRELHAMLAATAKKEDVSLNQYVVYLLGRRHALYSQSVAAQSGAVLSPFMNVLDRQAEIVLAHLSGTQVSRVVQTGLGELYTGRIIGGGTVITKDLAPTENPMLQVLTG